MFQRGVTLIELMVVIAIVAILSGIAVPSFSQLIADANLSSQVNGFMADARFARSEAMKRGISVTMCASANSQDINATCGGVEWTVGWIVFIDKDGDSARSTDEQILRRQDAMPSSRSISGTLGGNIRFNLEGRVVAGIYQRLLFTSNSSSIDVIPRMVCIPNTGRITLAERTATPTCAGV